MRRYTFLFGVALVACSQGDPASSSSNADCMVEGGGVTPAREEPEDELTPLRLLRRASIALLGVPPTDERMQELLARATPEEQFAYVEDFIDEALEDPRFYDVTFEFARKWFNIPLIPNTADAPEYGPKQQRVLTACKPGTANEGALYYVRDSFVNADTACGAGAAKTTVEPWWAPGTTVTLVGSAANTTNSGQINPNGAPVDIECNARAEGTCGCGKNAVSCWHDPGTYPGWAVFLAGNPDGQRRLLAEEPARLFAHIVWHDRPATDLILSDYSVGPTEVQAAHVNQSLAGGALDVLDDESWWNPASFEGAAVDPRHEAKDPKAWREYAISARNAFFLKERNYTFDPRKDPGMSKGFPSAGMLTSLGFLDTYPRERLRAARALEALACELILPPGGDIEFNRYETDPGREGPCQHCHARIDTAALHFKRYGKTGSAMEGWGAQYYMPGVGTWQWDPVWRTGAYPYEREPFAQWNKWYNPGSLLTPATEEEANANPYALFLDFLPPELTLLGQTGDGTVGPLGFAKIIVAAGAFDRCVVRRVHERVVGRDIDPATENGYLDTLTASFVSNGRLVRPFIKSLTQSTSFRRGQ
ncbi:hypothetical protein [Polyangium sp. 6x1]|uniref:hypothetical protein n=1 Tax=Polyangium sp. 6x1 TaxID=3042689 RepID=UPI00248252F8|nr:hypothetical protein [Polyangium sp. 6x1]MDI1450130.1 hypothetical protein [Polyangium sp. 6x1]